MDTERGVLNTGVYWGEKGGASGRGRWGGIAWGEMPDIGEEGMEAANHLAMFVTYVTILHDLHMYPRTSSTIQQINKTFQ